MCHKAALDVSLLSCISQGCVNFITETVSPFPCWSLAWLLIWSVGKVLLRSGANDVCLLFSSAMTFDIFTFNGHQNKDVCVPFVPQHRKTKALGDLSKVCEHMQARKCHSPYTRIKDERTMTHEGIIIKARSSEKNTCTLFMHLDILAFYPTIHHCVTGWATQYSDKSACQEYRVCLDRLAF